MPPVPTSLLAWEANMLSYGRQHADWLAAHKDDESIDMPLEATYYDAARVFYQIVDYTGDPSWLVAARDAVHVYRDRYVLPNNGGVTGFWLFARGLAEDFRHTGDTASRDAVLLLSQNAAFGGDLTAPEWTVDFTRSRETAYNLMAELEAESLGAPHRARTDLLADQALGHIDQWTDPVRVRGEDFYVQPFMVGLTCEALIGYEAATGDARVLPKIEQALDWLWVHCWLPSPMAFVYIDVWTSFGGPYAAPDLNLLIAPAYAWVYHRTGDVTYRDRADAIFSGGVASASLYIPKQFNQNYRWSFACVEWLQSVLSHRGQLRLQLADGRRLWFQVAAE